MHDDAIIVFLLRYQHAELVEQQKLIDAIVDFNEVARRT